MLRSHGRSCDVQLSQVQGRVKPGQGLSSMMHKWHAEQGSTQHRGSDSKVLLNNRGEAKDEGPHIQLKVSSERNPLRVCETEV